MKIALAQLNYHIGNFRENTSLIRRYIELAKKGNADLVVFSELCVCGYPPRDFLEYEYFIRECEKSVSEIAGDCHGISAIIGSPTRNKDEGKRLHNSALLLSEGKISAQVHKSLLPNYDVFDEYRYFEPGNQNTTLELKGIRIALTVCEDIWDISERSMYRLDPLEALLKESPDLIINISASPYSYDKLQERKNVVSKNASRYKLPLLYVNQVGAQTELIFDGGSLVSDASGNLLDEMNYFSEDLRFYEVVKTGKEARIEVPVNKKNSGREQVAMIHDALVMGIRDYFVKSNFQKAILGLSGGIDSAVVLALAAKALGNKNVLAVLMPSQFSSGHSVDDAKALAIKLGVAYEILPIHSIYQDYLKVLDPIFTGKEFNVAEENLQARIRGGLLMAVSNKLGYILLNTSNKSELAVGYGTLYGDMCGGISVLGDVYKTQVYELARYMNREEEIIPENTITKAPSAELRPGQTDQDSLPPYDVLDKILKSYIEGSTLPENMNDPVVRKVLHLVNMNEYKRWQFAPILRVSHRSFGAGRRMPIVSKYTIEQ